MGGDIEYGTCELCGKESVLSRTYFRYPFKDESCSPKFFVLVRHCDKCVPSIPTEIHPVFRAMDGKEYIATITNILPSEITGEFIITDPVITK